MPQPQFRQVMAANSEETGNRYTDQQQGHTARRLEPKPLFVRATCRTWVSRSQSTCRLQDIQHMRVRWRRRNGYRAAAQHHRSVLPRSRTIENPGQRRKARRARGCDDRRCGVKPLIGAQLGDLCLQGCDGGCLGRWVADFLVIPRCGRRSGLGHERQADQNQDQGLHTTTRARHDTSLSSMRSIGRQFHCQMARRCAALTSLTGPAAAAAKFFHYSGLRWICSKRSCD
jgi:hypothetical protein